MSPQDPLAEALWEKIREDFEQDRHHRMFIEHARSTGDLPGAARRYRELQEGLASDDPAREAVDRHLSAITLLAVAQLEASRPERSGAGRVILKWLAIGMFLLSLLFLVRAMLLR